MSAVRERKVRLCKPCGISNEANPPLLPPPCNAVASRAATQTRIATFLDSQRKKLGWVKEQLPASGVCYVVRFFNSFEFRPSMQLNLLTNELLQCSWCGRGGGMLAKKNLHIVCTPPQ